MRGRRPLRHRVRCAAVPSNTQLRRLASEAPRELVPSSFENEKPIVHVDRVPKRLEVDGTHRSSELTLYRNGHGPAGSP